MAKTKAQSEESNRTGHPNGGTAAEQVPTQFAGRTHRMIKRSLSTDGDDEGLREPTQFVDRIHRMSKRGLSIDEVHEGLRDDFSLTQELEMVIDEGLGDDDNLPPFEEVEGNADEASKTEEAVLGGAPERPWTLVDKRKRDRIKHDYHPRDRHLLALPEDSSRSQKCLRKGGGSRPPRFLWSPHGETQ